MPGFHRAGAFTTQSQSHFKHNNYTEILDPGVTFEQLFDPAFWVHARRKLQQDDLVRLIANDRSFDVTLTVTSVPAGGVMMRYLYGDPGANIKDPYAAAANARRRGIAVTVVPLDSEGKSIVRIQHLPATKWRILGLNGEEVKRNIPSREEAEKLMGEYLKEINMRLPDAEQPPATSAA